MEDKRSNVIKRYDNRVHTKIAPERACPECRRDKSECLCGKVTSFSNRTRVVILQHPQEQFKLTNSASLAHLILRNSILLTGLSWKSFKSVAGESEQPSQWAILYLKGSAGSKKPLDCFNRNGDPVESIAPLRGIIAVDGSWKQAKTLWWRNSWFLKLNRISLNPDFQSIRNQSKDEGLSTIEAIAFLLKNLGEKAVITDSLLYQYKKTLFSKISDIKEKEVEVEKHQGIKKTLPAAIS